MTNQTVVTDIGKDNFQLPAVFDIDKFKPTKDQKKKLEITKISTNTEPISLRGVRRRRA